MTWIQLGRIAVLSERAAKVAGLFQCSAVIIELYGLELVLIDPITVTEQLRELLLETICPIYITALPQSHLQRVQSGLIGRV